MSSIIGYFLHHLLLVCLLNPVSYLLANVKSLALPPFPPPPPPPPPPPHHHNKALFVFGDSLFDSGNFQYLNTTEAGGASTYWPYGETFFHHATGRFSDGRIVPDFICKFANLHMLSPYLQPGSHKFTDGTNFASADAAVLPESDTNGISLPMQLYNFKAVNELLQKQLGVLEAKSLLRRAVYLISIGGIDYGTFYSGCANACTESQQREFVGTVIGNLTNFLREIYDLGGRKFAYQNVGPAGCAPAAKLAFDSEGCVQALSDLAGLHNIALASALEELKTEHPGFKYAIFDYYNAMEDRVVNPATYGFENATDACCGSGPYRGRDCAQVSNGTSEFELCSNPGDYLWFDGGHTNERANQQLAELLWSGTPNVTGPNYNVKELFEDES